MSRAFLRSGWTWIVVLLLIAAVQIVHRTPPVRHDSFFFDFSNVYSASRAWLQGHNPYSIDDVYHAWNGSRHGPYLGTENPIGMRTWAAVYPPSSLILIAPFAALTAVWGHLLWVGVSAALLAASIIALISLAELRDWKSRMLFIACALASAPVQCCLESGQPALPAGALVILAVWAFANDRLTLAGVMLGIATAVKLQVGGPFILYYLFLRQWRVGALATALFAVATIATIARMESFGISTWCADWHRNVAATLELGGINDPRPGGPFRNDMVNLQTLLDVIIRRQFEVNLCVLMIFMPMLVGFLSRVRQGKAAGSDLLALSLVTTLSMLPLYRRLYDGVLLMMLLAWALGRLRASKQRGLAIVVLALLSEFLVPIDLIPFLLRRTHIFDASVSSAWWQGLVVPHHAWGLLIVTAGTFYVFNHRSKPVMPAVTLEATLHPAVSVPVHSA